MSSRRSWSDRDPDKDDECRKDGSLISNPHFSRRRNSISGLILTNAHYPLFDYVSLDGNATGIPSFTFLDDARGMRIVDSCNGLFCCTIDNEWKYYIYNPATQQYTTLPRPGGGVGTFVSINLAFDPSKSPYYKAVCVCVWNTDESEELYQIEIYSSETGSWRPSGDPSNDPYNLEFYSAIYWNGGIHCVGRWGSSLYFDIEGEILGTMSLPPIPEGWKERGIMYFGESQGHLHLVEIYDPSATQFDVLEMESDYSKWFVKYHVNLDNLTTAYPEMVQKHLNPLDSNSYVYSVLCLVSGENEEDSSSLVLHIPGKVISYNLKDKTFKQLLLSQPSLIGVEDPLQFECWFFAHQYNETLLLAAYNLYFVQDAIFHITSRFRETIFPVKLSFPSASAPVYMSATMEMPPPLFKPIHDPASPGHYPPPRLSHCLDHSVPSQPIDRQPSSSHGMDRIGPANLDRVSYPCGSEILANGSTFDRPSSPTSWTQVGGLCFLSTVTLHFDLS
ncbi:hypothetical protein HHK36_026159 [Tetracentron sinense]|uniref:F-box associated beta-propeller type 1 domain-containing protein n=1 Tax=Tetracentron sinense TaxID=13715 RepID=A0A835D731_TETSI|nr:hypothetical protein HHK36_026159 [Tetracentron sinense]